MTITLQPGYSWGPKLTKPGKLAINGIDGWVKLDAGNYDVITIPVGDNWHIADPDLCAYSTVKMNGMGCISIRPRFPVNEPSAGYLFAMRGPYQDGVEVEKRGDWKLSSLPAGMVNGRVSMPVWSHNGARSGRYYWNGMPWCGNGYFPELNSNWWGRNPIGPKMLWTNTRAAIVPCQNAPDITIINNLPKGKIYVSITKVDMFGRETEMSDPVEIDIVNDGSRVTLSRRYDTEVGTSGFYLYAGKTPDNMHRQPVLNREGMAPKYVWPLHLQQYTLHDFKETNIRHVAPPSYGIASIIPKPLKDVVDGKTVIEFDRDSYDIYCPIMLPYNVAQIQKNGRIFGAGNRHCTFVHKTTYGNAQLVSDIPMVLIQNQRDDLKNCTFRSNHAYAGVTFSDWSGGQNFKNEIDLCNFEIYGEDSTGFLVDDSCTIWWGNHSVSETRIKRTMFVATTPVLIEGNQSAKISFVDMCSFIPNGNTRYLADTAAIYSATPNDIDVIDCEGINGTHRAIACACCYSGPARISIENFFVDAGANVYAVFATHSGGEIIFKDGERINFHSQNWIRCAEAPNALWSTFRSNGVRIVDRTTAISFQLNQLSLDLDFNLSEFIAPTEEFWLSKGRVLEYPAPGNTTSSAYYDFRRRKVKGYTSGFSDAPDSILPTQAIATVFGQAEESKKTKYENNYSHIMSY